MNKSKKRGRLIVLFIVLILIVIFLFILYEGVQPRVFTIKDIETLHIAKAEHYNEYSIEYQKIKSAFDTLFIEDILPKTNLQTFEIENTASGDDILSESLGLMMLIAIEEEDAEQFQRLTEIMHQMFLKENGLLKWRISTVNNHDEIVNATVDDLRVVKVLYEAAELWDEPSYKEEAIKMGKALYEYCSKKDLLFSYDTPDSPFAILTYYDFKAMLYLATEDQRWTNVVIKGINEVYRFKVDSRPFYEIEPNSKTYRSIENLMILQHLYEVGLKDEASIGFIKDQIMQGGYYAAYSKKGQIKDDIESPAIYGIIAQIAKLSDDVVLYRMACQKILDLANADTSQYAWAFVDKNTHVGYSFDHLMTLLGL